MLKSQRSRIISAVEIQQGETGGYAFGPAESVPEEFNAGFSLYAAAWPIVATYPGHSFQTGLCGTWMHPHDELGKKPKWSVVSTKDVPPELGLTDYRFETPKEKPQKPRITPDDPESSYKKSGPAAGPFEAHLGDGSVVTYYWYRFADQPAMLNADLTPEERELFAPEEEDLFRSPEESVTRAYKMQGEKVAYHEEVPVLREEPSRYGN